jgi:uncharacterized membrane protein YgdD (TMEM256/DUF423 family)
MTITANKKILVGAILMALGVSLGAIGAHALEKSLSVKQLATFKTGVNYHFLHAIGILILGCLEKNFDKTLTREFLLFLAGVILFSFNCYAYAITGIKDFAMIVPIGGVAYIVGWILLATKFKKN